MIYMQIQIIKFLILWLIMFATLFFIIGIIIFRVYIIPKIEKRLSQRLSCNSTLYKISIGANAYGKSSEFWYIAIKYLYSKITKDYYVKNRYFKRFFSYYALDVAGYKIEEATKLEVYMSLFLCICIIVFIISALLFYFKILQ